VVATSGPNAGVDSGFLEKMETFQTASHGENAAGAARNLRWIVGPLGC